MIKVLLVDDDYLALEGLCRMLHWDDFNGELSGCATDGIEAISMIEDNPPDVVVADIKMPRMNGIELSRYLYENHRGTRIILLSGHSEFEYAQKALQYRVTDYILKPVTRQKIKELETLLMKIDRDLAAKKQIRRLAGSEALKDRLLSLLRRGDEKPVYDFLHDGVLAEALLHDTAGTLGSTLLNYTFAYQSEIGKDKSDLEELKKKSMDEYWRMSSPPERVSYLYSRCRELMSYARNRKSEYEQPIVAHCIQVIQNSFSEPGFNISQLADRANLSLPYLSTVFKQAMGQTISSYLSRQRLLRAQELLRDISIPIKDVCAQSGYEDPHYFARSFKKQTGMTPSEYRNLHSSRDLHPEQADKEANP